MELDRRSLLRVGGLAAAGATVAADSAAEVDDGRQVGCLVDTTLCVGCRRCEQACNEFNNKPDPPDGYGDETFLEPRRPSSATNTVVNRYPGHPSPSQMERRETFSKVQCMHCLHPACVSACIVGALYRDDNGIVNYDADKCIGCRYCQVACPFGLPTYEYEKALAPRVAKCLFCFERTSKEGGIPACAAACPREAIVFGTRKDVLELARARVRTNPARYVDHIYGEHEVGGTSWLYLAGRPFHEIGFLAMGDTPVPELSEAIQHGIFKYFAGPIGLYAGLGGLMWFRGRRHTVAEAGAGDDVVREGE